MLGYIVMQMRKLTMKKVIGLLTYILTLVLTKRTTQHPLGASRAQPYASHVQFLLRYSTSLQVAANFQGKSMTSLEQEKNLANRKKSLDSFLYLLNILFLIQIIKEIQKLKI